MDATRRSQKCVQCNPEGQRRHTVLAATRQRQTRDERFGNNAALRRVAAKRPPRFSFPLLPCCAFGYCMPQ
jgi:hypothetical protein